MLHQKSKQLNHHSIPSSLKTSASSVALSAVISPALAKSVIEPNSLSINPANLSTKSIIAYPTGSSSFISLLLFHRTS
ncbi:hypothetical protein NC653_004251 [Populus alba x Populus x berolinensis]|uniref:Uncharacterized protein n=1 Tax=Populus alba x Populus x berolinensis TaxID=444605 RepID=A0AAD6RTR3_9ROSI|nr:hypothetical protein NC653_004251 [Populus alba x Populus x berolinensis]